MPTTTKYIWDEENLLAEADGADTINVVYTNEPQQYGNLVSARISGATSYHHFDALGSTRQLTDEAGHVGGTAIYDATGNAVGRTSLTGIAMLWIGELGYYSDLDAGILTVRERIYLPATARWTSLDRLSLDSLNRYLYAINNPTTLDDPSGLAVRLLLAVENSAFHERCGGYKVPNTIDVLRAKDDPQLIIIQTIYSSGTIKLCDRDCGDADCNIVTCTERLTTCEFWEVVGYMRGNDKTATFKDTMQRPRVSKSGDCPNTKGRTIVTHDLRAYKVTQAILTEISKWKKPPSIKCHGLEFNTTQEALPGADPTFVASKNRPLAAGGYEVQIQWDCCLKSPTQTASAIGAFGSDLFLGGEIVGPNPGATLPIKRPTDGGC